MTKEGEWNCEVNEELSAEAENNSVESTEVSSTASTQSSPKPATETVTVEPASPTKPQAAETARSVKPAANSSPVARNDSEDGEWQCSANELGEWQCDNANDRSYASTPSSQKAPAPSGTSVREPASQAQKPSEITVQQQVIGDEWQCAANSNNEWDCQKTEIFAAALPFRTESEERSPVQQFIKENPYSRLDWVYYQNRSNQQCAGQYLEPQSPVFGDENLAEPPLYLEAAQSSSVLGGLTQLQGGVNMRQGSRRVSSISAEVDQVTNKARLEGDVKYREPGLLMLSDNAQIDTVTNEAIFSNAEFVMHEDNLRGTAERIIHLEDERIRLEQGTYTYCPPFSEAWGLEAESTVLNREEGFGVAEDAVLRIAGVPVLYTPYFSFPLDDTRKSGFLAPSLSYGDESGIDLAVPYYFNIAPNMDDTFTPRYISDRGLLLQNEFRYLNSWSMNELNAAYLPDDDAYGDDRWLLAFDHTGKFAENWSTKIDYTSVSDDEYFEDLTSDLDVQREDHLDQNAAIVYAGNGWKAELEVHDYQTIDGTAPYKLMPQFTVSGRESFQNNVSLNYLAELTRFDRDLDGLTGANRVVGDRVHLNPSLEYLWQRPWGYIRPRVSLWSSSYSLDNQLTGFESSPDINSAIASLDSGLFFDRDLANGGTHTLEPRLFALFVPEEDHSAVPDFDTSRYTFNYNYLFRENRFSGKDRLGDTEQVSLGITTRYITASGFEKANFQIGQAYYFADREVQLSNSTAPETNNQSDIATRATWYLSQNTKTYLDTILDSSDYKVQSSTLGLKYNRDYDHVLNFRYRYTDSSREQADLSYIWPLSTHWTSMGRLLYDIRGNETEEASLGLEYESCCWKVSLAGRHWLDGTEPNGSNKYDYGIFLQLTLKGLGSFGSGDKGFLDDIIGYEEREEQYEN